MSRLRRLALSDRFFFVTCNVLRGRRPLSENEFGLLARLIASRRQIHGFLLTAWVLLPDHWHAIVYPRYPLTVSEVMETIKVSATRRINRGRQTLGPLFQSRFFDRALRVWGERGLHPLEPGAARLREPAGSVEVVKPLRSMLGWKPESNCGGADWRWTESDCPLIRGPRSELKRISDGERKTAEFEMLKLCATHFGAGNQQQLYCPS